MPTPPSRRDLVDFVAMNSSKVSSVPTACTHQVDTAQDTPPCSSNTAQTELFDSLLDLYQSTSDSSSLECDISAWSAGCILKTNGTNATCSTDSPPIENPQIEHPPHIPRNKSRRYILLKTFDESSCEANGFNVKQVLKPQPLSVSVHPLSDSGSSLASCLDSMQAALAFEQPEIDAQFPCINSALEKRRARSKSIQAEQSHSTRSEGHLMELEEFSPVNNSAICGENLEVARPNANLSIDFCHVALAAEPESITNQCSNMVTRFENYLIQIVRRPSPVKI
ncbi:hypothetical protein BJ741DRAFT_664333 [Chytriomyces cf. hyalinus JEL632]|nr:hypothetical protein BJ741DRAFT_664333 [Chytriomyces cf. hyalinus JEL632]